MTVPLQLFGRTTRTNPLVLFNNNNNNPVKQVRSPWVYIAENVVPDLISSFENVRNEKLDLEDVKPKLVARFGKIHELPDSTISCKCSVIKEEKRLQLYKIELHQVRHMVIDISCLDKNLDLRLMLSTKRILTALTDNELQSIKSLINSAILDPDVKGGLRWPLGRASCGGRYCVVGVWHTIAKDYKSSSLSLKVRHADRYDFRTSTGETTREINLKLKNIVSLLQEQDVEVSLISEMLKDHLRLIWDHFLCYEHFLT